MAHFIKITTNEIDPIANTVTLIVNPIPDNLIIALIFKSEIESLYSLPHDIKNIQPDIRWLRDEIGNYRSFVKGIGIILMENSSMGILLIIPLLNDSRIHTEVYIDPFFLISHIAGWIVRSG